MRFLGATATGSADPVFGKDLSFYLLALPLYGDIVGFLIAIVVITIVIWAISGLIAYQRRQDFLKLLHESGAFHSKVYSGHDLAADEGVLGGMDEAGHRAGHDALHIVGGEPLSQPLSPRHQWTFKGGRWRVLCGRALLDTKVQPYDRALGCYSLHPGNRILYTPVP